MRSRTTRSTFRTSSARTSSIDIAGAEQIARAAGLEERPIAVSVLGAGVKANVYRVDFDGRDSLALKVYERPVAAERELAGYAAAANVPGLPRFVSGSAGDSHSPHGWVLISLADGEPLNRALATIPRGRLLDVYRDAGRFLRGMHAVELDEFSVVAGAAGSSSNREYVERRFDQSLGNFVDKGGNRYLAARIRAWFNDRAPALERCDGPVLCHGDLHAENITITKDLAFDGVLDLEESFAGDPAMDIARTHHARFPFDRGALDALLEGYGDTPAGFDDSFAAYFLYYELELWNFFANGGSRGPLHSISRRMAKTVGAERWRIWRSSARRRLTHG